MNKSKIFFLITLVICILYIVLAFKQKSDEKALVNCVENILTTVKPNTIKIDASGRLDSPIISGTTSINNKKKFVHLINTLCNIQSFEDMIVGANDASINVSNINFTLDGYNQTGTITGLVNNAIEKEEILSNFTEAVNENYGPWTIQHQIITSKLVKDSDFAIDLTLVFQGISLIRSTDITFINKQIIVKGFVRNNSQLEQTLMQLNQIFQEDLEIIHQLVAVTKEENEIEKIEIELDPIELPDLPEISSGL